MIIKILLNPNTTPEQHKENRHNAHKAYVLAWEAAWEEEDYDLADAAYALYAACGEDGPHHSTNYWIGQYKEITESDENPLKNI